MLSVREQLRGTLDLWRKAPIATARLEVASLLLRLGFGISLGGYLVLKLVGVVVHQPPAVDLAVVPAGICALGLAVSNRRTAARVEPSADEETSSVRPALLAGALLVAFTVVYLTVNTVPFIWGQDESATVYAAQGLVADGSLQATSPLNDRYHTNIVGALHVSYRTATEMYYRTFPGTAMLYAPFLVFPDDVGYRLFTAGFGTLAIAALYLVSWKLLHSWHGALVAALVFAVSPVFGSWAVTIFNNVPVLALELCALAVVLWSRHDRPLRFGVAGALVGLACFVRVTEVVFVVPLLVLVFWRTRTVRPGLAFAGASLAGLALIPVTNQIFFGNPLFLPHVGSSYIPIDWPAPTSSQVLQQYSQLSIGTTGVLHFGLGAKLDSAWFHVRYLSTSTFAFPFLAVAFVGLAWRMVAGKRDIWLLVGGGLMVALAIVAIYGHSSGNFYNYYGFAQPIVRSSFVRYSLPVYALLAIGAGAFFLDAGRVFRGGLGAAAFSIAMIGAVVTVGVAQSYDFDVYGFNRLNAYRRSDQAAWNQLRPFLDSSPVTPLVIGGLSVEKLIDSKYKRYFINYNTLPPFFRMAVMISVAQQAATERDVYVITSVSNSEDKEFLKTLYAQYQPKKVLQAGLFRVDRLRPDPPKYTLAGVDVWNTNQALDRWSVTVQGYLRSNGDNNYVQLVAPLDGDGDGRVDQDVRVQFEVLDGGPDEIVVKGFDSHGNARLVPLFTERLEQTWTWRKMTILFRQGEHLRGYFVVSRDVTIGSIAVVAAGS